MICEVTNLILSVFTIILKIYSENCKESSKTVNTLYLEWLFLKSKKNSRRFNCKILLIFWIEIIFENEEGNLISNHSEYSQRHFIT